MHNIYFDLELRSDHIEHTKLSKL